MNKLILIFVILFYPLNLFANDAKKIELLKVKPVKNNQSENNYQILKNETKINELYQIIDDLKLNIEQLNIKQSEILNRLNQLAAKSGEIPEIVGDNLKEFNYALNMLEKGNYDMSERAFKLFIEKYPNDQKIGEVYFFLGESAYRQKNYKSATKNYLVSYRDYRHGKRRDESLYKLSLSLNYLGKKQEACEGLLIIMSESTTASKRLKETSRREINNMGCRN
jgi:tetratricopeptide (TPR) repeat protein